jgi:hypothetical protein
VLDPSTKLGTLSLQKNYEQWMSKVRKDYFDAVASGQYSSLDEYLVSNSYFITITFRRWAINQRKVNHSLSLSDPSLEWDAVHALYRDLARKHLGPHFDRKTRRDRLPLLIAGIDHPEAKYAQVGPMPMTNLHVHALIAFPPAESQSYKQILNDETFVSAFRTNQLADSVDLAEWDSAKGMSYILKAYLKAGPSGPVDLIPRIYPNPSANGLVGYRFAVSQKRSFGAVERLRRGIRRERYAEAMYVRLYGRDGGDF